VVGWSGEWRGVYLWFARDWLGYDAETRFRRDFRRVVPRHVFRVRGSSWKLGACKQITTTGSGINFALISGHIAFNPGYFGVIPCH
jgi:hypothetical protein